MYFLNVRGETRSPSFSSSPAIRASPQMTCLSLLHLVLHATIPGAVALLFFRPHWKQAWLIMFSTMLVDLDHLCWQIRSTIRIAAASAFTRFTPIRRSLRTYSSSFRA